MTLLSTTLASLLLFSAEDTATVHVVTRVKGGTPVSDAAVEILTDNGRSLITVFQGKTGADGTVVTNKLSLRAQPELKNCTFRASKPSPDGSVLFSAPAKCAWHVPGEYPRKRTLVLPIDDFALKLQHAGLSGRSLAYQYDAIADQYVPRESAAVTSASIPFTPTGARRVDMRVARYLPEARMLGDGTICTVYRPVFETRTVTTRALPEPCSRSACMPMYDNCFSCPACDGCLWCPAFVP